MGALLLFALAVLQAAPAKPATIATPKLIGQIDTGKLKGEPTELAWAPDGTQFFLQTSERNRQAMVTSPRFYLLSASDAKAQKVDAKPDWEGPYWLFKSNEYAPGAAKVAIDVKDEQRVVSSTASPTGGALAKGGTSASPGTTVDDAVNAATNMQQVHVITLMLKGEQIGQFVNEQFLPGYTFSWSPEQLGSIVYVNDSGRLAIMTLQGSEKQEIDGTKNVLLPAWKADGTKIAFLQKSGRNKYDLYVADVQK
jgi:hypothetical protein